MTRQSPETEPFFSIIIPTYNADRTLNADIESSVRQKNRSYELLIIDGSSSDNTLKIVEMASEAYDNIRWVSEKDKGIYDAMNKGIKMARGKWLFFLGADDELYDSYVLDRVFAIIQQTDALMVYGNVNMCSATPGGEMKETVYDGVFTREKLWLRNICHQA